MILAFYNLLYIIFAISDADCVSTLTPACKISKWFDFVYNPSILYWLELKNHLYFPGILIITALPCVSSTKITIFSDDISTIEHWTRYRYIYIYNWTLDKIDIYIVNIKYCTQIHKSVARVIQLTEKYH